MRAWCRDTGIASMRKTASGALPITDSPFRDVGEGSSVRIGGKSAVYSYAAGAGGNDLTLTVAGPWVYASA